MAPTHFEWSAHALARWARRAPAGQRRPVYGETLYLGWFTVQRRTPLGPATRRFTGLLHRPTGLVLIVRPHPADRFRFIVVSVWARAWFERHAARSAARWFPGPETRIAGSPREGSA